jgi:hypothetical protein
VPVLGARRPPSSLTGDANGQSGVRNQRLKVPDVQDCTVRWSEMSHHPRMKKKDVTVKQLYAVPCPTCGVPIGKHCVLKTGANRTNAHVNRRLAAIEQVEKKS